MGLILRPCTLRFANDYITLFHRHHKPTQGMKFAIRVDDTKGHVRGVVIVGRPLARMTSAETIAEATRLCTDGTRNACSILYAAAARAAAAMGYEKIQTFILESEDGTSLKAAGWEYEGMSGGGTWSRPSRGRQDKHPLERKQRWAKKLR